MAAKSFVYSPVRSRSLARDEASITPGMPIAAAVECPVCGHHNPPGSRYCSDCGSRVDLVDCPYCEAINSRDSVHCYKCNAALAGRTTAERDEHPAPSSSPPEPVPTTDLACGKATASTTVEQPIGDAGTRDAVVETGTATLPLDAINAVDALPLALDRGGVVRGPAVMPGLLERAVASTEPLTTLATKRRRMRRGLLVGAVAIAAGAFPIAANRTAMNAWIAELLPARSTSTDAAPQHAARDASGVIVAEPSVPQPSRVTPPSTGADTGTGLTRTDAVAPVPTAPGGERTQPAANAPGIADRASEQIPGPAAASRPTDATGATVRSAEPAPRPGAGNTPPARAVRPKAAPPAKRPAPGEKPTTRQNGSAAPNARALTVRTTRGAPASSALDAASPSGSDTRLGVSRGSTVPVREDRARQRGGPVACSAAVAALGLCQ